MFLTVLVTVSGCGCTNSRHEAPSSNIESNYFDIKNEDVLEFTGSKPSVTLQYEVDSYYDIFGNGVIIRGNISNNEEDLILIGPALEVKFFGNQGEQITYDPHSQKVANLLNPHETAQFQVKYEASLFKLEIRDIMNYHRIKDFRLKLCWAGANQIDKENCQT